MKRRNGFTITLELVLIFLFSCVIISSCLSIFTDNFQKLFSPEKNYKQIFQRTIQ